MDNEIQQLFTKWCEMFPNLKSTQGVIGFLKDSKEFSGLLSNIYVLEEY